MVKRTTLYSPDGRKYETSDKVEITRLKAQGYTETDPNRKTTSTSKSTSSTSDSS